MIMFVKHSTVLSESKEKEITNRFMLVFTGIGDLDKINQARLEQHIEQVERDAAAKKLSFYRQVADIQIQDVIAAMMSVADFDQNRRSSMYDNRVSCNSGMSVLNDS